MGTSLSPFSSPDVLVVPLRHPSSAHDYEGVAGDEDMVPQAAALFMLRQQTRPAGASAPAAKEMMRGVVALRTSAFTDHDDLAASIRPAPGFLGLGAILRQP